MRTAIVEWNPPRWQNMHCSKPLLDLSVFHAMQLTVTVWSEGSEEGLGTQWCLCGRVVDKYMLYRYLEHNSHIATQTWTSIREILPCDVPTQAVPRLKDSSGLHLLLSQICQKQPPSTLKLHVTLTRSVIAVAIHTCGPTHIIHSISLRLAGVFPCMGFPSAKWSMQYLP